MLLNVALSVAEGFWNVFISSLTFVFGFDPCALRPMSELELAWLLDSSPMLISPSWDGTDLALSNLSVQKVRSSIPSIHSSSPTFPFFQFLGIMANFLINHTPCSVNSFKHGDEVFFAGTVARPGSYAEYTVIDQDLIAIKPKSVDHVIAASMPLGALTAWQALERLHIEIPAADAKVNPNASKTILVTAGAGGVGSIAIQLAKHIYKFGTVIATASRPESIAWCKAQGADVVLDRSQEWKAQLEENGIAGVDYFALCYKVDDFASVASVATLRAQIVCVSWVTVPVNMMVFWPKQLSICFMQTAPQGNGVHLSKLASFVDSGIIKPWVGKKFDKASVANIREAHRLQASGNTIGKITIAADYS